MKRFLRQLTALVLLFGIGGGYALADIASSTGKLGPVLGGGGSTFTGGTITSTLKVPDQGGLSAVGVAGSTYTTTGYSISNGALGQVIGGTVVSSQTAALFTLNSAMTLGFGTASTGAQLLTFGIGAAQTPDTAVIGLPATGNSLVLAEVADIAFDFAHAVATDPTLFIHSHNQSTTERLDLYHDGTRAQIQTPSSGGVRIGVSGGASLTINATSNSAGVPFYAANGSTASPSYVFTSDTGTGMYNITGTGVGFSVIGSPKFVYNSGQFALSSAAQLGFSSAADPGSAGLDTFAKRAAAGVWSFGATTTPNVASATTIAATSNLFHVTGTTNVTNMTVLGANTCVSIIFDGVLTFTDGNNLKLAGNFVTTADDTIQLCSDGTNWYEIARAVN